jgi:hypothetical protein
LDLIVPVFARHEDDFANRSRLIERADCVNDQWFARDTGKQFIESHPLAVAARDDNGAEHNV